MCARRSSAWSIVFPGVREAVADGFGLTVLARGHQHMHVGRLARITISTAAFVAAVAISPATADDFDTCYKGGSIDTCTRAINSGMYQARSLATLHVARGNHYLSGGEIDRAIADYGEAIKLSPKDANIFKSRGDAYRRKGDFDGAIVDYSQAIRLDPKESSFLQGRGAAYRDKGDLDRAIADYSQTIKLDPKNFSALYSRGRIYRNEGELDRAMADYDQSSKAQSQWTIKLPPRLPAITFNARGDIYILRGELDRAINEFNQAIKLDPKYARAVNNRGYAYELKGDRDRAVAEFNRAIQLDPKGATGIFSRADLLRLKGDLDGAEKEYAAAVRVQRELAKEAEERMQRSRTVSPSAVSDLDTCRDDSDDGAIAACTRAISSGKYGGANGGDRAAGPRPASATAAKAPARAQARPEVAIGEVGATLTPPDDATETQPPDQPTARVPPPQAKPALPATGEAKSESRASDPDATVRVEYELTERVGTAQAWDAFLARHPKGFYSDLARAQRAKLVAREPASGPSASPQSATRPAPAAPAHAAPAKSASPPKTPSAPPQTQSAPAPREQQVVCDRSGCRPVPPNCHVTRGHLMLGAQFGGRDEVVCK